MYSGFAHKNTFSGLEPRTLYRYRIKYKGDAQETPWSRPVEVCTTKKPPSAEDLHKAVLNNDLETCKALLRGETSISCLSFCLKVQKLCELWPLEGQEKVAYGFFLFFLSIYVYVCSSEEVLTMHISTLHQRLFL